MKKNLSQLFDEAAPEELEQLLADAETPALPQDTVSNIQKKVQATIGLQKKKKIFPWKPVATAACLCLILCGVLWGNRNSVGTDEPTADDPIKIDPTVSGDSERFTIDFSNVLWALETEDADNSADGDSCESSSNGSSSQWINWKGLTISQALKDRSNAAGTLAIRAASLRSNKNSLQNHVYQGQTYAQIQEISQDFSLKLEQLYAISGVVDAYSFYKGTADEPQFWEKLYYNADQDLADSYFNGEDFDLSRLEQDIYTLTDQLRELEKLSAACAADYRAQYCLSDFHSTMQKLGYSVLTDEITGITVVFVPCENFETFAADVVAAYEADTLENWGFTLASPSDISSYYPDPDSEPVEKLPGYIVDDESGEITQDDFAYESPNLPNP